MNVETIEKWEEILNNAYNFNKISNDSNSKEWKTYSRFGKFSNWYYFPSQNFFAPNKFIGYKNTTGKNYKGSGHGTQTKNILNSFFVQVKPNSPEFLQLSNKLEKFAESVERTIAKRTYTTGGIFVPKNEFSVSMENVNDTLVQGGESSTLTEGVKKSRFVSYYERNPLVRNLVISKKGLICSVCGFDYYKVYGERGRGYIEVHHAKPVSTFKKEHQVDPNKDMEVVCANCHRMIHRSRNNVLSVQELKELLN